MVNFGNFAKFKLWLDRGAFIHFESGTEDEALQKRRSTFLTILPSICFTVKINFNSLTSNQTKTLFMLSQFFEVRHLISQIGASFSPGGNTPCYRPSGDKHVSHLLCK